MRIRNLSTFLLKNGRNDVEMLKMNEENRKIVHLILIEIFSLINLKNKVV